MSRMLPAPHIHVPADLSPSQIVARSFWAHDPYACPDSDNARIAALSKEFIQLFEKALAKRHCQVMTGVEIESSLDNMNEAQTTAAARYIQTEIAKHKGKPGHRPSGIHYAYKDQQLLEVATRPQSPSRTVGWVVAIKRILLEATREFPASAKKGPLSVSAESLKNQQWGHIRFGQESKLLPRKHEGEHINLSLHITDQPAAVVAADLGTYNTTHGVYATLLEKLLFNTESDALLYFTAPASIDRYRARFAQTEPSDYHAPTSDQKVRFRIAEDKHSTKSELRGKALTRLEWRVPDSASDIHLSMLVAMASVYLMSESVTAVLGAHTLPPTIASDRVIALQQDLSARDPNQEVRAFNNDTLAHAFISHSRTLAMMRSVVSQLIPEPEQAAYFEKIEQFKTMVIRHQQAQYRQAVCSGYGRNI